MNCPGVNLTNSALSIIPIAASSSNSSSNSSTVPNRVIKESMSDDGGGVHGMTIVFSTPHSGLRRPDGTSLSATCTTYNLERISGERFVKKEAGV